MAVETRDAQVRLDSVRRDRRHCSADQDSGVEECRGSEGAFFAVSSNSAIHHTNSTRVAAAMGRVFSDESDDTGSFASVEDEDHMSSFLFMKKIHIFYRVLLFAATLASHGRCVFVGQSERRRLSSRCRRVFLYIFIPVRP